MHFAFIDVDNLFKAAIQRLEKQGLTEEEISYFELVDLVKTTTERVLNRNPDRSFVYYATPDEIDIPDNIIEFGAASRFILRTGQLTHKHNRKVLKQQGVDVMLAVEAMQHSYRGTMKECTLFSVDGDFLPLVDELVANGTIVNVAGFPNPGKGVVAPAFQRSADLYIQIETVDLAATIKAEHRYITTREAALPVGHRLTGELVDYDDCKADFFELSDHTVGAVFQQIQSGTEYSINFPSHLGAKLYAKTIYGQPTSKS